MKQKLTELKGKTNIIIGILICLSIIDSMAKQKISTDIEDLQTITQLDMTPTKHSTQQQHILI